MSEVIINGPDDLYSRLSSHTINPSQDGPFVAFFTKGRLLKDPKVCGCKKGKKEKEAFVRLYTSIPSQIRNEPWRSVARRLLGDGVLVFLYSTNGPELARIG